MVAPSGARELERNHPLALVLGGLGLTDFNSPVMETSGITPEQIELITKGLQAILFSMWVFFGVSIWYRW